MRFAMETVLTGRLWEVTDEHGLRVAFILQPTPDVFRCQLVNGLGLTAVESCGVNPRDALVTALQADVDDC